MTEDEERHADEVNIAFQMGAEWERKQSKARIEKLEAALDEAAFSQTLFDAVVGQRNKATDRIEKLEAALRSIAANACCDSCREAALVARKSLEGKDD